MSVEHDGVQEEFAAKLRVALSVAGQLGEQIARAREQAARQAEAESVQATGELAQRMEAERGAMRAQVAPAVRDGWWETAGPEEIGEVWQTARAWRDFDPEAARAAGQIRAQIQDRHCIDPDAPGADPGKTRDALTATPVSAARRAEEAEATRLMATAASADRDAARVRPDPAPPATHDAPMRHKQLVENLKHLGDREAVEARLLADQARGRPPEDAIRGTNKETGNVDHGRTVDASRVAAITLTDPEAAAARGLADEARGAPPVDAVRNPPRPGKARASTARPVRAPRRKLER